MPTIQNILKTVEFLQVHPIKTLRTTMLSCGDSFLLVRKIVEVPQGQLWTGYLMSRRYWNETKAYKNGVYLLA